MGTFDSVYKNKIRQLEEENLKLKRTINEVYGQGAYPNPVDSVDLKPSDLEPMQQGLDFDPTDDELIREYGKPGVFDPRSHSPEMQHRMGAAHVGAGLENDIPANHLDNYPHYAAGVARGRRFFGL